MNTHSGSGRGDIHTLYRGQSVDNLIIEYMEENNIPGMSLAIVQAPYITRVVGYGFADTEKTSSLYSHPFSCGTINACIYCSSYNATNRRRKTTIR